MNESSSPDSPRILLVDDTPDNLKVLRQALEPEGYNLLVATSGVAALKVAREATPDLILLDVLMPGIDGFETCRRLKQDADVRHIPVIFITARAEAEAVVEGFRVGGVDYIVKPFNDEEVLVRVATHLEIDRLTRELVRKNEALTRANRQLEEEVSARKAVSAERNHLEERLSMISYREAEKWGIAGFVGKSRIIGEVLESIGRLQNSEATVLITGESGTGKELIARAIHHGSPRSRGPFVPVNCSAIPGDLAESTLFGHVKGAFTGADRDRTGYFEVADGGTLFLDEVGDMPADIQGKLLRVLEDGGVLPVGSARETRVDVRVVAATNRDLQEDLANGKFRQDLYYRIARFPVHVPPLRERREDIPLLASHFLRLWAAEMGADPPPLDSNVQDALTSYDYPGNVRELKNIVERALIHSGGRAIRPEHLQFLKPESLPAAGNSAPASSAPVAQAANLPLDLKSAEDELIRRALERTHGNIAAAARILHTNRPKIYKYLQEHPDARPPQEAY